MTAQQPIAAERPGTLATYSNYAEAQRAVDYLSDEGFPVENIMIVAQGLRYVEQVTGRRGWPQALAGGAGTGLVVGAFLGWLLGLFSLVNPIVSSIVLALWGAVIGAVIGAVVSAVGYWMSRGERDFSSVGNVAAERYEVMVSRADMADDARRLLARMPAAR